MGSNATGTARRRRILVRSLPLVIVWAGAFVAGAVVGSGSEDISAAQRFANAWERQDFKAMYGELDSDSQAKYPLVDFTKRYVDAQTVATVSRRPSIRTPSGRSMDGSSCRSTTTGRSLGTREWSSPGSTPARL